MNQSQYGRHRKVSRQRIHQYIRQGLLCLNKNGKIDVKKSDKILALSLDVFQRHDKESEAMGVSLKPRDLKEQDTDYEDETEDDQDNLGRRKEIISIIRTTREELMRLPLELCGKFALEKNPIEIKDILENRLRGIILELAKSLAPYQY